MVFRRRRLCLGPPYIFRVERFSRSTMGATIREYE